MKISEKQGILDIVLTECPEHISIESLFPDTPEDELKRINDKIYRGEYIFFCAKVSAEYNGMELASDFLGGCIYSSLEDFRDNSGYYEDMKAGVILEAQKNVKELFEKFNNL